MIIRGISRCWHCGKIIIPILGNLHISEEGYKAKHRECGKQSKIRIGRRVHTIRVSRGLAV